MMQEIDKGLSFCEMKLLETQHFSGEEMLKIILLFYFVDATVLINNNLFLF